VINKFRGAVELLEPGVRMLCDLTARQTFGIIPWRQGLWLDAEDSLALPAAGAAPVGRAGAVAADGDVLRVAVVKLPRISNFTDIDALASEPGVLVRFADTPAELADADLVVLPGSRATVADLGWLRERGLAEVIARRARRGGPVLGICGGYQMLAGEISDEVESRAGVVPGLALLPARVEFAAEKRLRTCRATADGVPVTGYEIHHGVVTVHDDGADEFVGGCRVGGVWGTSWHGVLESDEFRRGLLAEVAALAGRDFTAAPDTVFAAVREARLDVLGDLVGENLDTAAVCRLIESGPPADLPIIGPASGAATGPVPAP